MNKGLPVMISKFETTIYMLRTSSMASLLTLSLSTFHPPCKPKLIQIRHNLLPHHQCLSLPLYHCLLMNNAPLLGSHSTSQPHSPPQNSPPAPAAVELHAFYCFPQLSNSTVQPQSPTNNCSPDNDNTQTVSPEKAVSLYPSD